MPLSLFWALEDRDIIETVSRESRFRMVTRKDESKRKMQQQRVHFPGERYGGKVRPALRRTIEEKNAKV